MTHDDAFVQDIIDNPHDLTPRLVYADWLEEHGDAAARDRATFIRVQIELGQCNPDSPRARQLDRRQRQLLRRHGKAWLGSWTEHDTRTPDGMVDDLRRDADAIYAAAGGTIFRDGFVDQVSMEGPAF